MREEDIVPGRTVVTCAVLGYHKVVLTTDNERSLKAFAKKIKEKTACDVVLRTRVAGSSASLGSGETSVQLVAGGGCDRSAATWQSERRILFPPTQW